jgi:sulfur relay (sulfurtransferase) DsrF/TusC family protein
MTDYSTILLRLREIFDKVVQMNNILFSKEEEKDIRTITLRKDAPKELGTEKYLENMATILNYQFATEAPIKVICNGMFNLINNCKNQDSYVTTLRQSAVSFLSYIAQYDVKKEYRVQESIKENDTDTREEIFAELENLPISNKNITEEQKGHYGSFRFTLSSCFCIKEEKGIPSK